MSAHKEGCKRGDYEALIAAIREEREGSQAAGLDEDDWPCSCELGTEDDERQDAATSR